MFPVTIARHFVLTAPRHSANLSFLRVFALAFLFPRFELSSLDFKLSASPLNPFLSHHSRPRACNPFPLISLHKTGGYTPPWSDHSSSQSAPGCQLLAVPTLLSPFTASLTKKQGGQGLVLPIPAKRRAGWASPAPTKERRLHQFVGTHDPLFTGRWPPVAGH